MRLHLRRWPKWTCIATMFSTVTTAAEMLAAVNQGIWDPSMVRGDLPTLLNDAAPGPRGDQSIYFRSIGLGIEYAVVALATINLT